jgi:hypothetical protein
LTDVASFISARVVRRIGLGAVVCAVLGSAAAATPSDSASEEPCPATAARIVLWHSGKVTLNSVEVPIDKLGSALAALAPRPTEVCYSQENPRDQSPDLGSFFEGLIFLRMPISMYTDISFLHRAAAFPGRTPNNRWRGP